MSSVLQRIDKYLKQLSPHMMGREGVVLLKEAAQEIQRLTSDLDSMVAAASSGLDATMKEYAAKQAADEGDEMAMIITLAGM